MTIINEPTVSLFINPSQPQQVPEQKVLFIGQKVPAGTAVAGDLVNVGNQGEEDALFGENSMLAAMIRAARIINPFSTFDAIPLDDDGAATAATGDVTFGGAATEDGSLEVTVGSSRNHTYTIAISNGDTAATVAANLETEILADTQVQVTPSAAAGVVTLTADNAGEEGNLITLRVTGTVPAGLTVAITGFTGGATNPVLTTVFDPAATARYQTVIWPSTYDFNELTGFLDPRWNVVNNLLDGVGITTKIDTFANLTAFATAENSQNVAVFGFKPVTDPLFDGASMVEFPAVISSMFGAVRALRFTQDANLNRYVTADAGSLDLRGGDALASVPYHNTPFYELDLIDAGKGWTETEYQALLDEGVSTMGNDVSRNLVICSEVRTLWKSTIDYIYLNYVDTDSKIREVYYNAFRSDFRNFRLTGGELVLRRNIANEASIRSFVDALFVQLSGQDFVLTQAGPDAVQFFKENRTVTVNVAAGEVEISFIAPIVGQLRSITGNLQFVFSVNS